MWSMKAYRETERQQEVGFCFFFPSPPSPSNAEKANHEFIWTIYFITLFSFYSCRRGNDRFFFLRCFSHPRAMMPDKNSNFPSWSFEMKLELVKISWDTNIPNLPSASSMSPSSTRECFFNKLLSFIVIFLWLFTGALRFGWNLVGYRWRSDEIPYEVFKRILENTFQPPRPLPPTTLSTSSLEGHRWNGSSHS